MRRIFSIVEGEGDAAALPVLIRHVLAAQNASDRAQPGKARHEHKGTLLKPGELERIARTLLQKAKGDARVLLLIDADDDGCAATLGPELQQRLDREFGAGVCAAVVAVREYENWLLADASALGRDGNFRDRINPPGNPEEVRNAKHWLSDRRTDGRSYRPTADQAPLTAHVNVETIRERCRSFRKLWREVARLAR